MGGRGRDLKRWIKWAPIDSPITSSCTGPNEQGIPLHRNYMHESLPWRINNSSSRAGVKRRQYCPLRRTPDSWKAQEYLLLLTQKKPTEMTTQELLIWEGIQSAKFIKGTQLQSGVISTYLALLHNNSRSAAYVNLKITVASEEASSKKN